MRIELEISNKGAHMIIRWVNVTPIFDKYEQKKTHRQAAIDSSMPGEFKKWN